jgi:hypothetical protein
MSIVNLLKNLKPNSSAPKKPQESDQPVDPLLVDIDVDFLRLLEGEELKGYVPTQAGRPIGNSGVTISTGFDLGQWDKQSLQGRISPKLLSKLEIYLGSKKWAAIELLKISPLTITKEESKVLARFAKRKTVEKLMISFGLRQWNQFDPAIKTVLTSVAYQYGDLQKRCPKLFKRAYNNDIVTVIQELENFGDAYPTRRKKEANYLKTNSVVYLAQVGKISPTKTV